MKAFRITQLVSAEGYQNWIVRAENIEDAVKRFMSGEGTFDIQLEDDK